MKGFPLVLLIVPACSTPPAGDARAASPTVTQGDPPRAMPAAVERTPSEEKLAAAREARESGDHARARALVAEAIEGVLAVPSEVGDEGEVKHWADLGRFAREAGELKAAKRMWEQVLAVRTRTLPDDHPDLQRARSGLAQTIKLLGDLVGARALEEQVLAVYTRTLPDEHLDLQRARGNLVVTMASLGDLAGARALQEQVLAVLTRTLPDEHPDLQAARGNLALTISSLGDLTGARALQERVLAIRMRTLPDDHPDLQVTRLNLAETIRSLGDLAGARALQEQVLAVYTRTLPDEHPDLQAARGNLALTIKSLGDLAAARVLEEQVLASFTGTLSDEHPDLQAARSNLASTLMRLGDLAGARRLFEQVLAIRMRTLPEEHPFLQSARSGLALTIRSLGDLAGARALQEQVLAVYTRTLPEEHPDLQAARGNLAGTIKSLGDLAGARALQEQVLAVYARTLPDEHPNLQRERLNLAETIRSLGDLAGARTLQEQALAVYARTLPDDHPDLQRARGNLAATMASLGDLAGARTLQEQVLAVYTQTLPDDHPDLQRARGNLAWTLGAETTRRALSGGAEGESERDRDRETCTRLLRAAAAGHQAAFASALASASPREVEEAGTAGLNVLAQTLSFAAGYGALGALSELESAAFTLSETTRGAAVRSASWQRRAKESNETDRLRARVRRATDELARLAQSGGERDAFQAARAEREAAQRELAALPREPTGGVDLECSVTAEAVANALRRDEAVVAYRRFNRHDVEFESTDAESSPPRVESTESLSAFVVRPGIAGAPPTLTVVPLGKLEPIELAVHAWRDAIGLQRERGVGVPDAGPARTESAGTALRKLVWDPILLQIGEARRLVVVLDDVLQLVVLDALPLDEGRLVGERWRIEPRVTLGELLDPKPARVDGGVVVALGGASFHSEPVSLSAEDQALIDKGDASNQVAGLLRGGAWERGFTPLTYTGLEAREIAALHQEVFAEAGAGLVLEKRKASRASIVLAAPRARWLHVATHGWYAPESVKSFEDVMREESDGTVPLRASSQDVVKGMNPMLLCGLALAGANLPEDALGRAPGLFTAEEMSALDLSNCELAVLSACDTNVGIRRAGQGVASFQRALQMAGARSVITSLWKVPDEATRELMLDFYRRIWVLKQPKWQALWEAKMALRNAKDERSHPRYALRDWAAWVLTGEPE